jgi:hypothetical protein
MKPRRNFWRALKGVFGNLISGRLLKTRPHPTAVGNAPRIEFSYTIYWTKLARHWDPARRAAVRESVRLVLAQPGFEANAYERRYSVPGLDAEGQAHSGASLTALEKVLAALAVEEDT